jgi:predicted PhzF superfamily epimerase YddE/YHI9
VIKTLPNGATLEHRLQHGNYSHRVRSFFGPEAQGNFATVIILKNELSDREMQEIAQTNSTSATSYLYLSTNTAKLWNYSRCSEIAFCGHGILAAAAVIHNLSPLSNSYKMNLRNRVVSIRHYPNGSIGFESATQSWERVPHPKSISDRVGVACPRECWLVGGIFVFVYEREDSVRVAKPNFPAMQLDSISLAVTSARPDQVIVSRYFSPSSGQDEDAATGSLHAHLAGFWCPRLGVDQFTALQFSTSGGEFICRDFGATSEVIGFAKIESQL